MTPVCSHHTLNQLSLPILSPVRTLCFELSQTLWKQVQSHMHNQSNLPLFPRPGYFVDDHPDLLSSNLLVWSSHVRVTRGCVDSTPYSFTQKTKDPSLLFQVPLRDKVRARPHKLHAYKQHRHLQVLLSAKHTPCSRSGIHLLSYCCLQNPVFLKSERDCESPWTQGSCQYTGEQVRFVMIRLSRYEQMGFHLLILMSRWDSIYSYS